MVAGSARPTSATGSTAARARQARGTRLGTPAGVLRPALDQAPYSTYPPTSSPVMTHVVILVKPAMVPNAAAHPRDLTLGCRTDRTAQFKYPTLKKRAVDSTRKLRDQ